jgi:hypothetical protein
LFQNVNVKSWVGVSGECPINYYHQGKESVDFTFGMSPHDFEFGFDVTSLREFLKVGAKALEELEQGVSPA